MRRCLAARTSSAVTQCSVVGDASISHCRGPRQSRRANYVSHRFGTMRQMTLDLDTRVLDGIAEAKTLAADGNTAAAQRVYRELLAELDDDPRQAVCVLHMYAIVVDDLHEKLAINEEALRRAAELS